MQVGYNHNIRHKGKYYHIQTEDSGKSTMTISTLLYSEGSIVASKKANYSKIAAEYEDYSEQLKELMQKQHKRMLIDLKNGHFDDPEPSYIKEPVDVKEAEDKTIEEAIEATGEMDSNDTVHKPPPFTGKKIPAVEEKGINENAIIFTNKLIASLKNTLLSLTQKEVYITKDTKERTNLETLSARYDENIFIARTKIYKGGTSECAFICDIKTASIISNLVLLDDSAIKEKLSKDYIDALKDTFNQGFGASVPQLASIFSSKTSYDPVKLFIIDAKVEKDKIKALFAEKDICVFNYTLKIGNILTSKISFLLASNIKNFLNPLRKKAKNENKPAHIISEEASSIVKAEDKVKEFNIIDKSMEEQEERELKNVELIKEIEVDVKIKLGDTIMPLKKISKLAPGTIIELNKDIDSLLDLIVNDKTIAEGVLVVASSNNFALRITKILDQSERIKRLGGS